MDVATGRRAVTAEKPQISIGVVALTVIGVFLISRTVILDGIFPCGIALITVLVSRSRINFYLLPVIMIAMGTHYNSGYHFWGDLFAVCVCGLTFVLAGNVYFSLSQKAFIAAASVVICNSAYYVAAGLVYALDIPQMIINVMLTAALVYLFDVVTSMAAGRKIRGAAEGNITAILVTSMLLFGGTGFSWAVISAGMILTLFAGYKMGIMEGGESGIIAGIMTVICAGQSAGIVLIFAVSGIAAGYFKGQSKAAAALCFGGVCMGLNLINLSAQVYMPIYGPLTAMGVLIFTPRTVMKRLDLMLSGLVKGKVYNDIKKNDIVSQLQNYHTEFESLSNLYGIPDNSRTIISYQFKGMMQVIEKMIKSIEDNKNAGVSRVERACKYHVDVGQSGYAGKGGISGDSHIWRQLPDGRFIMILSDGMGNGEKAAIESNLAVTTIANLIEVGFDVELALKTVNAILLKSEEEIFSTVDMMIVDKNTGRGKLYKIGAAATFIKRKGKVEAVKMPALPMGIVDGLHIDYINVNLKADDEIVMVSDGITDSKREDPGLVWLKSIIGGVKSKDPQTMCDLIINKAVENYGIKEKDDLTVLTARIS